MNFEMSSNNSVNVLQWAGPDTAENQTTISHQTPPGCLGRRTWLKVCIILAAVVVLSISLVVIFKQKAPSPEGVCLTKGCDQAATRLIESMNETVDPCEDFYQFACGGFLKKTIIPDDKVSVTRFTQLMNENLQKLRGLVEAEEAPTEPHFYKIVKNFFKSCMDTEGIEKKGLKPLKDVLRQMGGWPVLEGTAWDQSTFSWTHNTYINRQLGYSLNYIFNFVVTQDYRNSSRRIISIDQPLKLGMPSREQGTRNVIQYSATALRYQKMYHDYQVKMAVLLGADRATAEKELRESLQFELEIAKYSLSYKQRLTAKVKVMTIDELAAMVPEIPWLEYINRILSPFHTVTVQEPLVVIVPEYLKNLAKLLERTPKRVIANYMLGRVTQDSVPYLTEDARNIQLEYLKKVTGKETREPRWKECMNMISQDEGIKREMISLSPVMGGMYVRELFTKEAKSAADAMVAFIRRQFEKMLQTQDWMDPLTRRRALAKAKAITPHVAYPPEALMDDSLAEKYDGLVITNGDFLENMRNFTVFAHDCSFKQLRQMVNKKVWRNYRGANVDAFYIFKENSIKIPAGILQGSFFQPDQPNYMNFGGIGYIIGHEITHGFDNLGRNFDASGSVGSWWRMVTDVIFQQKSKCITNQYENYLVPEVNLKLNGFNTLAENIADNGGIKVAYQAYNAWTKEFGEEKKLPSLPYTPKQLFWLSAANTWCSKYRPETLQYIVLTSPHSPPRFRVNGPFSNRPEFAEDWKCPAGSKLNPVKKCSIW